MSERQPIQPTYDGAKTGPRYHVTSRINGHTITHRYPIEDPFVRHTIHISWRDRLRSLFMRRFEVEVMVGGDRDIIEDVLELNSDYLGLGGSERRKAFHRDLNAAIVRHVDNEEFDEITGRLATDPDTPEPNRSGP